MEAFTSLIVASVKGYTALKAFFEEQLKTSFPSQSLASEVSEESVPAVKLVLNCCPWLLCSGLHNVPVTLKMHLVPALYLENCCNICQGSHCTSTSATIPLFFLSSYLQPYEGFKLLGLQATWCFIYSNQVIYSPLRFPFHQDHSVQDLWHRYVFQHTITIHVKK